jgi:hypothetical protein
MMICSVFWPNYTKYSRMDQTWICLPVVAGNVKKSMQNVCKQKSSYNLNRRNCLSLKLSLLTKVAAWIG